MGSLKGCDAVCNISDVPMFRIWQVALGLGRVFSWPRLAPRTLWELHFITLIGLL